MLVLDKAGADKILLQLENKFINSRYKFYKVNNEFVLLGKGGFSYVYEMYDSKVPKRHYAAKIVGLGTRTVDDDFVVNATRIQFSLGEQSENISRVIALWTMKLDLDANGELQGITRDNEKEYPKAEGVPIHIILMEKLDSIISKDKYGNVTLLRKELRTEEGVIRFAKDIGNALITVHNNGFLHRDVKLENIFWDQTLERYKLGDFGISRFVGDGDAKTVVYTDGYGAPEIEKQLTNSYNKSADIYSFGITIFLLLNNLKFPAADGYHSNIVQYSKDFIVPAPMNSSEGMARIIRKMCSYRVGDRYKSIEEVLVDIDGIDDYQTDQESTEFDDLATETYRELSENKKDGKIQEEHDKISLQEKEYSELNREERKKLERLHKKKYMKLSLLKISVMSILFMLLFKAFSPSASYVSSWMFWILPVALFIESVLEKVKEFHIEFEILVIGLAVFASYKLGIDIPMVVMIIVAFIGVPTITAGCAIGTGLWIAQMLTGKMAWLSFVNRWDLGWVIILGLMAYIEGIIFLRNAHHKITIRNNICMWIFDKSFYVLILAGIILFVLSKLNLIVIPEIVKHIHLVRIGIGMIIIEACYLNHYGLILDKKCEDDEIDEHMDE